MLSQWSAIKEFHTLPGHPAPIQKEKQSFIVNNSNEEDSDHTHISLHDYLLLANKNC